MPKSTDSVTECNTKQFITVMQKVFFLRKMNGMVLRDWVSETKVEQTQNISGQRREQQTVRASQSLFCLSKATTFFFLFFYFLCHSKNISSWHRRERDCTRFCPTLIQNQPNPQWWKVGGQTKAAIVLPLASWGGGCLTVHILWKQVWGGGAVHSCDA